MDMFPSLVNEWTNVHFMTNKFGQGMDWCTFTEQYILVKGWTSVHLLNNTFWSGNGLVYIY